MPHDTLLVDDPFIDIAAESATVRTGPAAARLPRAGGPSRCWYTGGVSLLLAATSQKPPQLAGRSLVAYSRFGVDETVDRIEALARRKGLYVPAKITLRQDYSPTGVAVSRQILLALGLDPGLSPFVQKRGNGSLALPLGVQVSGAPRGWQAQVTFSDPKSLEQEGLDLPAELYARILALPALIDQALA